MTELSVVGKRIPKEDGAVLACGQATFTGDVSLPGMLIGKIKHSHLPHARIIRIDTSRAKRLTGVKAIITGKDIAPNRFGPFADEYALAIDKIRYVGEPFAAVAAIDEDVAQEALDLITLECEELPALFDPEEALKPGAVNIHEKGNLCSELGMEYGDVDEAFAIADYVRQDRFITNATAHCAIEPHIALASYDRAGRLKIWTTNQSPQIKRRVLASTLGIGESDISVTRVQIGGAFGGKAEMIASDFCAAVLSKTASRPVRITYTREEVFVSTRQRHPMIIDLKTGVRRDGTLLARECRVVADGGAYNSTGPMTIYLTGAFLVTIYKVPNVRYKAFSVYTNKPTRGAQRGHGQIQECFASDSQLDMIAVDLGIDPVEIRVRNAVEAGDSLPNKMRIHTCELKKCLEKVADSVASPGSRDGSNRISRGRGIAASCYISGLYLGPSTASGAYVKFNEDGKATVVSGGIDIGQGFNTVMRQIAAEELGLPFESVRISSGDSDGPCDIGSYTSSTTFVTGNAVKLAAADARRQLLDFAGERLEASPVDLEIKEGRIFVKGTPEKGISVEKLVMTSFLKGRPIIGKGTYMPRVDIPRYGDRIEGQLTPAMSYAAQVAEVEVDRDTGEVRLLKVTEALDCGRAVNPLLVEGQVHGSVSMCQGQGLLEDVIIRQGQMLNPHFADYKLPSAMETVEVRTEEVRSDNPEGPFGAKEAGETSVVPTATAIANAVYDAVGVRIKELPITPEKVLAALDELAAEGRQVR